MSSSVGSWAAVCPAGSTQPTNLRRPLSRFVGRNQELAAIPALLTAGRLLTITGPAGVGKTRLALETAACTAADYPDGVWLVELAAVADPALVTRAVAQALGVRDAREGSLVSALAGALAGRRVLLLLDNCEHVVLTCAGLADSLLSACPGLHILATSREPLGIAGEQSWPLQPLAVPDPQIAALHQLHTYAAIQLFVDRAATHVPTFALTDENGPPIAQLCAGLDGLPLAIELAASRVRMLGVVGLSARLGDRLRLLAGGPRTATRRHQTLRAALDWSYDLLPEPERRLFERLSVFCGRWDLAAAEAVCADASTDGLADRLAQLVDKSLVVAEDQAGVVQYRLLETFSEYAADRLRQRGTDKHTRERHAAYFLALAEHAELQLWGPEVAFWLIRLDQAHDNLRAALRWFITSGAVEAAGRLASALYQFWFTGTYAGEGRAWLWELLTADGATSTATHAKLLTAAGSLAIYQGDYAAGQRLCAAGLGLWQQLGANRGQAWALYNLGAAARQQGQRTQARALLIEGVAAACKAEDAGLEGYNLHWLGWLTMDEEGPRAARLVFEQALERSTTAGYARMIAMSLMDLGWVAAETGNLLLARRHLDDSLARWAPLNEPSNAALTMMHLGRVATAQGDTSEARRLLGESLLIAQRSGDAWLAWTALNGLMYLAIAQDQADRALRLGGAVEALGDAIGFAQSDRNRRARARQLAPTRRKLGDEAAIVWAAGRALSLAHAIEFARSTEDGETTGSVANAGSGGRRLGRLTAREQQVASLIARGLSNRAIAEELVLSKRTVERHVEDILDRLGLDSRTQIAAWAIQRDRHHLRPE